MCQPLICSEDKKKSKGSRQNVNINSVARGSGRDVTTPTPKTWPINETKSGKSGNPKNKDSHNENKVRISYHENFKRKSKSEKDVTSTRVLVIIMELTAVLYTLYVLGGTVAWVGHIGEDLTLAGYGSVAHFIFPASAHPGLRTLEADTHGTGRMERVNHSTFHMNFKDWGDYSKTNIIPLTEWMEQVENQKNTTCHYGDIQTDWFHVKNCSTLVIDSSTKSQQEIPTRMTTSTILQLLLSIEKFFRGNLPLAFLFLFQHSAMRISTIVRIFNKLLPSTFVETKTFITKYARLLYCLTSAITLNFFLCTFRTLPTPIVMNVPISPLLHAILSISSLLFALVTFVKDHGTWNMLGAITISQWMRQQEQQKQHEGKVISSTTTQSEVPKTTGNNVGAHPSLRGMDAITWMGRTVWNTGGPTAFIIFTGISIIPRRVTLADCLVRGCAAFYLRKRSRAFRMWMHQIESIHLTTWVVRSCMFFSGVWFAARTARDSSGSSKDDASIFAQIRWQYGVLLAFVLMIILRRAEKDDGSSTGSRQNIPAMIGARDLLKKEGEPRKIKARKEE